MAVIKGAAAFTILLTAFRRVNQNYDNYDWYF